MQINIQYDSSVSSLAPTLQANFKSAVQAAVDYYDHVFTDNVNVTITFGYGTVGGHTVHGFGAQNWLFWDFRTYNQLISAYDARATTPVAVAAEATFPGTDPTGGGNFAVDEAMAQLLGFSAIASDLSNKAIDIGLNSSFTWDWSADGRGAGGVGDAVGALEHEISETLGRFQSLGSVQATGTYTLFDMFRYTSPGVRMLSAPGGGFFSFDGQHMLLPFNNPANGGDPGDWASSVNNDAFGGGGTPATVSMVDLEVMQALGYHTAAATRLDFVADGRSGILFTGAGGAVASWEMGGAAITGGGSIGSTGAGWTAVGSGDFNGDLAADVLFQRASDGMLAVWDVYGTNIIGGGNIGAPGGSWQVVGVGDVNGDRQSDIVFQDAGRNVAVWEMNGTQIVGGGAIGSPGADWAAVGVGDFNGDGKSDVLFHNATSGDLATWQLNGTQIAGGGDFGNPGGTWQVAGVGDFNGDGKSDILFVDATGEYAIWEMNGTSVIGGGDIGHPGGSWSLVGVGDYNGDGHADLLFHDSAGDLAIWEMNGVSIIGGGQIGNPGAQWTPFG